MNGYDIFILILFARYVLPLVIAAIMAGIVVGRNTPSRALGACLAGGTAVLGQWVLILMALLKAGNLDVAELPLLSIFLGYLSIPVFVIAAVGAWIAHRKRSKPADQLARI